MTRARVVARRTLVVLLLVVGTSLAALQLESGGALAPMRSIERWNVLVAWGPHAVSLDPHSPDRQQQRDGCGAAALARVLRAHGTRVPQRLLWSIVRLPRGGTRLGDLARAARRFGHPAEVGCDPGLERTPLPALVHLRRGHFVVLESRGGRSAVVFDPGCGRVRVPLDVLRRHASGAVLALGTAAVDT